MLIAKTLFRAYRKAAWLFFLFAVLGCRSETPELQLKNILEPAGRKSVPKKELQTTDPKKERSETKNKNAAKRHSEDLEVLIKNSKIEPAELSFLKFPDFLKRVSESDRKKFQDQDSSKKYFPGYELLWQSKTLDIQVLADKTSTDRERILSLTRQDFLKRMEEQAGGLRAFYQDIRGATASFQSRTAGPLIILETVSKYLESNEWYTEWRRTYFYTPDYRLNLLIRARDEDLLKVRSGLDETLRLFEKSLRTYFKKGIEFRKPD